MRNKVVNDNNNTYCANNPTNLIDPDGENFYFIVPEMES